ncbi:MAG: hypothetical protein MUF50_00490 [Planctomycetes bacterium]|jgi:hypothetical protein|nr:hypothetical protein [Planctomycetota bacterium]
MSQRHWRFIIKTVFLICLLLILVWGGAFFAVRFNLTNTKGEIDKNNNFYQNYYNEMERQAGGLSQVDPEKLESKKTWSEEELEKMKLTEISEQLKNLSGVSQQLQEWQKIKQIELCQIDALGSVYPVNAVNILNVFSNNYQHRLIEEMLFTADLRLKNNPEFQNKLTACTDKDNNPDKEDWLNKYKEEDLFNRYKNKKGSNLFSWSNDENWEVITKAVLKDKEVLELVAARVGIKPRLIVSVLIVEQLRLYHTQRELFEKFFKPLNILADANKMAWGVMAIKEKTALEIEKGLKDSNSSFYLGKENEKVLDFNTNDVSKERYDRLTSREHYYSYLYGALFLKQIINQWQLAGYDIGKRPEILATIFNLGPSKSKPKAEPLVGGSTISIGEENYTFGGLAHEFYYSGLMPEFAY